MSFDGVWDIVTNTPMGKQQGTMTLATNGSELTGQMKSSMGSDPIQAGIVDGNNATFFIKMTRPMPMKLDFNIRVDGDKISGECKMGVMGKATVEGKRV